LPGAKGEVMSDQYMMKCLWKGVADTDQQQDAATRIQDLEARLEAMTQQHAAVEKAREAALREAAQCCDEVSKNYYEITQMKIGSEMCRADILALINKGDSNA
jgi:outer membrane murein-binding lipoprotein Lpp